MIAKEKKTGQHIAAYQWRGTNLWELNSEFFEPAGLEGREKDGRILFDIRTSSGTITAEIRPNYWCIVLPGKRMTILSDREFSDQYSLTGEGQS